MKFIASKTYVLLFSNKVSEKYPELMSDNN